jgi:ATP-dependent Clp protease ATP-binding subunit ClpX
MVTEHNEKFPDPKELEKEIGEFLSKKFGENVKVVSPLVLPEEESPDKKEKSPQKKKKLNFDLKPEELVAYLDQYIVKQDRAKTVLATKICTHFNRVKRSEAFPDNHKEMVGSIKNNVLMLGPTGVGKTYMIKLIANKIGVPFVKGDATKFSETGYVGGDVEDLVRDLLREADGDIERARHGIIYIDEIDKIASSRNIIGADVSRTGVQRALLKPMEETDVELKVPHDPISVLQEIEHYRKTGKRDKRYVNTRNILFIMSGAFADMGEIIKKRISKQTIGFGAKIKSPDEESNILKHVRTEDLVTFGFESEFVGRLPVRAVFERLTEEDLFNILQNPNNPVILGKKLDFAAYDIEVKFEDKALRLLAQNAFAENTGARGLVSAVEEALLLFEKKLPSTNIKKFPITSFVIETPQKALETFLATQSDKKWDEIFERTAHQEKEFVKEYIKSKRQALAERYNLGLSPSRIDLVASYCCSHITDIGEAMQKIKFYYDKVKKLELYFLNEHDINIVLEEDAMDLLTEQFINSSVTFEDIYIKISTDFEDGLKLVRTKTGKNRFSITKEALLHPQSFLNDLVKKELGINPISDNSKF